MVVVAASTGSASESEAEGTVVVGTVVEVSGGADVVVVGAVAVEVVDSSMAPDAADEGSTGSATSCSMLLIAIVVVGGSIAVGVSVTWSRTLLTAAEAMSTAATVTASQMSG